MVDDGYGVEYGPSICKEVLDSLCGRLIGSGSYRRVYECAINNRWVVKIEKNFNNSFSNAEEYGVWEGAKEMKDSFYKNWLAPCHFISPNGRVLIQSKTRQALPHEYPTEIPAWFTDMKLTNYGMIGKKFVCHDYGNNKLLDSGFVKRMRKARWWSLQNEYENRSVYSG